MNKKISFTIRLNNLLSSRGWKNRYAYWLFLLLFMVITVRYVVYFVLEMLSGRAAADALSLISAIVVYLFISVLFLVVIKIIQNFNLHPGHFSLFPTRMAVKILSSNLPLIYDPKSLVYLLPILGFTFYFAVQNLLIPIMISWLLVLFFLLAVSLSLGILTILLGEALRENKQTIIIGLWTIYLGYRILPDIVTSIPPLSAFQKGLLGLFSGDWYGGMLQVGMTFLWMLVLFALYAGGILLNLHLPDRNH